MAYVKRKYVEGQKMENQMKNPVKGIVAVISDYGVGKTSFALENGYLPDDMIFINDNIKAIPYIMQFKNYIDLVGMTRGLKILEFHERCLELIENSKKAKVIIWDTWTRFASTFGPYVIANQSQFRNENQYSSNGKIKMGEIYKDAYAYEGQILNDLKHKCDLLIVTFHLKDQYESNIKIIDRKIPGNDRAITEYTDLRLWLMNNPNRAIPTGIVLKNINRSEITSAGIKPIQVLPKRLEIANWPTIFQYWKKPIGNREPTEEEKPSDLEMSLIEGILTIEEKRLYEASIRFTEQQQKGKEKELTKAVQALNGQMPGAILEQIKAQIKNGELEYDGELTMKDITNLL